MEELNRELLRVTRQAYEARLFAGISGNLSAYDPENGRMVITPTRTMYETMGLTDMVWMELSGRVLSGHRKPSIEWPLHAAIYRQRPDVHAIVHTHSPYATALSVNYEKIPVILMEMSIWLGGEVDLAPFPQMGTEEAGMAAVGALRDRGACLLQNHGALTIGENLEQAYIRAVYLEDVARVYLLAKSGGDVKAIPEYRVRQIKENAIEGY
ncbi:MAG: class II aldolase/adducin family protein [Lachnospiraceae bacterium]|nr:class II aldolase/adducin family protein [Lachnospiraceae bacterium]